MDQGARGIGVESWGGGQTTSRRRQESSISCFVNNSFGFVST